MFLTVSTGLCSIYTWGLNSWGTAFVIMNIFHAVQYRALVLEWSVTVMIALLHLWYDGFIWSITKRQI